MNTVKTFTNENLGTVRTLVINDNPYFSGKDVAKALGYTNPQKAIRDHVDAEDQTVNESFTVNGTKATLINESGMYSLILSSKLPSAKAFKRWITSEVLPAIRKNGGYIDGQEYVPAEEKAKLEAEVIELHAMCRSYESDNTRLKEKVDYLARVIARDTTGDFDALQNPHKKRGNAWDDVDPYEMDIEEFSDFQSETSLFNVSEYLLMNELKAIIQSAKGQYIDNAATRHLISEIDRLFIDRNA